ncbi:Leucine--tRNA ligase [Galdieria sulphuraria]|nr:Leucine--tRNA ligase [Galdieria sulphuraria]
MFPYPSGAGLHVGHPEGYTATDIIARFKRMQGYQVLHPIGFDAFGLPAEQYAMQTGTHPAITTERNKERFRQQLKMLGFSYDWSREISTTDPKYYRWTQWIFLKLLERGLAYQDEVEVSWCPALGTVLSNEEVIDGKSERGGYPVIKKPMRQWLLRITAYADRLLDDLDGLDWPENIKEMQRNWIGRSQGLELEFPIYREENVEQLSSTPICAFTTRPETILGVTYIVIAPEYPQLELICNPTHLSKVLEYRQQCLQKSEWDRKIDTKKSGVFTGSFAVHPLTKNYIPIWVSDYVLASYGTGAIMAVPAHDERDYEFAVQYHLPIHQVIVSDHEDGLPILGEGKICHWNDTFGISLDGKTCAEARKLLMEILEEQGLAKRKTYYKIRDWLFSRQRYWGEPFPIVFVNGQMVPLSEDQLPVLLPETDSIQPAGNGESPLANIEDWLYIDYDGQVARRETNTMPQWAGSCWYYLRYIDPLNDTGIVDPTLEKYWMPVDLYVGGVEHAVLHLLYARFWHKVLYDLGVVSTSEPFQRLVNQGMILGETEYSLFRVKNGEPYNGEKEEGRWISASDVDLSSHCLKTDRNISVEEVRISSDQVEKSGDNFVWKQNPSIQVFSKAHKMSKSRGNVVNPDDMIRQFGADTLRLYLMFMGPLEQVKPWSTNNVYGVYRFLQRVWRLFVPLMQSSMNEHREPSFEQYKALHETIQKVTQDTEALRFNTAISSMMQFVNIAMKWTYRPRAILEPFVLLLAPYAPHIAEEIWEQIGSSRGTIADVPWPVWKEKYLVEQEIEMVIQVNGKVRHAMKVNKDIHEAELIPMAMKQVQKYIQGKEVKRKIYIPNKLINFVTRG